MDELTRKRAERLEQLNDIRTWSRQRLLEEALEWKHRAITAIAELEARDLETTKRTRRSLASLNRDERPVVPEASLSGAPNA